MDERAADSLSSACDYFGRPTLHLSVLAHRFRRCGHSVAAAGSGERKKKKEREEKKEVFCWSKINI
jgi:hypothetical protein